MRAEFVQAGNSVYVDCRSAIVDRIIEEACGASLHPGIATGEPDIHLVVEDTTEAFALDGWSPLTRDAYHRAGDVVLHNACGSGFDLRVLVSPHLPYARIRIEARYRPPRRERVAAWALRSRFHLLARAVLLQFPPMWVAGTRGRWPLHAAAVHLDGVTPLLVGPGGVGRSTLLLEALREGGQACSDNLCVSDGEVVHGVVEPVRVAGAGGRRMPHDRGELALPNRVGALRPDRVVVIRRVPGRAASVRPISARRAADVLVGGTYMAGELRRYWPFAATMAMGTGRGPMHPPIATLAAAFARFPCLEITLGDLPAPALHDLVHVTAAEAR